MLRLSHGLAASDLDAIAALERRVVAADGGRLKLGWPTLWSRPADEINDALWFDGDRLLGFAGIYPFGVVPELAGMVDPEARRRGIGTELARALLAELARRGVDRTLVVCPRTTGAGATFVRTLGGTPDHSEHALALTGAPPDAPDDPRVVIRQAGDDDAAAVIALLTDGFGFVPTVSPSGEDHLVVEIDGEPAGYLRAEIDVAAGRGDVYGFVVRSDLRGRGIGREVLRRTCADLIRRGASVVGLEVETDNESALGLYTSLGFRPVVTEDYLSLTVRG